MEREGEKRYIKREGRIQRKKIRKKTLTLTYLHGNNNNQDGGHNTAKCLLVCHAPPLLVHAIIVRSCGYQSVCVSCGTEDTVLYSITWISQVLFTFYSYSLWHLVR